MASGRAPAKTCLRSQENYSPRARASVQFKRKQKEMSLASDTEPDRRARLHVALIEPEIPPNTGNIARMCAATFTPLHLVGKLGFRTDEKAVRRAGLDYWGEVEIHYHLNID